MALYYVNMNPQDNGAREVHKSPCPFMPPEEARKFLGVFVDYSDALREAKNHYAHSYPCLYCAVKFHVSFGAAARERKTGAL